MYTIEIRVQCSEKFSEVLPQTLEDTEYAIEDIVSCSLLELFDTVSVEDILIRRQFLKEEDIY